MPLLERATTYVLDLLTDNEELKKFPREFINESVIWVKSWFLKPEDAKANAKLEDPGKSIEVKKDIIQDKLDALKDDAQFIRELTERLAAFEQQRARLKNVVAASDIDVKGSVHVGDKGVSSGDQYDEKNIIKGSTIKAGGDFRLGDDIISGNQHVHIEHHHYSGGISPEKGSAPQQGPKSELKALLAKEKTEAVIERLLDLPEGNDNDQHQTAMLLSARFHRINTQQSRGVITDDQAGIERNKINAALAQLIDDLE